MSTQQSSIVYYVLEDHTLGYVNEAVPSLFGVLAGDIHGRDWKNGPVVLDDIRRLRLRPATREDFKLFRVDPTGHIE